MRENQEEDCLGVVGQFGVDLLLGWRVYELIVYDLGKVAGSMARTPTDVLLPLGPRAFGLNGRRLGPRGVARETCARPVRLL